MATVRENFNYIHGDTYTRYFGITKLEHSPITQILYTVKQDQNNRLVIQKSLGNGITLLSEDDEKYHYMLTISATCSDPLKAETKYLHDIQVMLGDVKKTLMKGELYLEKEVTTTHCECKGGK